jgi:predicted alpha/beta hydrolase family esterase
LDIKKLKPRIDWKVTLNTDLGEDFEVLIPSMPNQTNAQYTEWEIMFNKSLELLEHEVVLVGHSLGAVFLAKYLTLHALSKKVVSLHLVAGPFDNSGLEDESLASFELPNNISSISKHTDTIFIYHSKDDPVVPVEHALKYAANLSQASLEIFENRGHMKTEHFPELVTNIRSI